MADPGRLDELKRKFEENSKRYFAPLANEYRKAGEPERAIELCRTYLPQQPTHMSGYIVYGQSLHDTGQAEESAAVFRQALTLDPENIIALRYLGDIARDAGDRVGAMRWYGKVLELDPRNEEIAAYITSLAQPGTKAFAPPIVPERQAPPTIRPEPEPDESAVRLEDIVSEPDVAQQRISTETVHAAPAGPSHAPESPSAPIPEPEADSDLDSDATEDMIAEGMVVDDVTESETGESGESGESGEPDEPFEPFGVTDWPTARDLAEAADDDAAGSDAVLEGPWHTPADAETPVRLPDDDDAEGSAPLNFADFMPEEDAAFAPTAAELGETAPVPIEPPAELPASLSGSTDDVVATAAAAAAAGADSPFITETMAELYLTQGLHGEALDIYRKLARRRDDPALRQRIAEIEAAQIAARGITAPAATGAAAGAAGAAGAGETVRAFFARIGAMRSGDRVRLAADRDSSLGALFGSMTPDANDISAAQRLAGAFGSTRPGNQSA